MILPVLPTTLVSLRVEDARQRVALEVGADQLLVGVAEDALERALGSAALTAALMRSTVIGFSATKVRSTTETLGVGTRMAKPSSLPAISGMTSLRALAAPVLSWESWRARRRGRGAGPCAACPG